MIKPRCHLAVLAGLPFDARCAKILGLEQTVARADFYLHSNKLQEPRAYFKNLLTLLNQLYLVCQLGRGPSWLVVESGILHIRWNPVKRGKV